MESGAETVLFVGDLSYADRYNYNDIGLRWDTWGRFVEQSTAYQPWIWSAGNHEIDYFPHLVRSYKVYLCFSDYFYSHSTTSLCLKGKGYSIVKTLEFTFSFKSLKLS